MSKSVRVLVLRTAGTNCNEETAFAFETFGAEVVQGHIEDLIHKKISLNDFHILAVPGGFSYGDDIAAGRILGNELRLRFGEDLKQFMDAKKLIIGICNGFQVLVKAGLLPATQGPMQGEATLMTNDSAKFEARWTHLCVSGDSVWTKELDDIVYFPVAHAEGKFVVKDKKVLKVLQDNNQIAFRYCDANGSPSDYPNNPNGSIDDIAGITDPTGRILGLMPHPERHFLFTHHPTWTRQASRPKYGDGAKIFENGVIYVKENLL